jgi:hypothetical protein
MWRFQPKAWDVYVNDPNPRSIVERARRDVPIEQLTKKMVIGIDARPHVEKLVELFRAGVTQVYVHSGQPDQQRVIEFYGRQVIPAVKAGLKAGARAA